MDINELGTRIIENIVANIPQFIVLVSTIMFYLKDVKKKTNEFPEKLFDVKKTLTDTWVETKTNLKDSFDSLKSELISINNDTKELLNQTVESVSRQIYENVNEVMFSMKEELSNYKSELTKSKDQFNLLVKENKVFMELISILVAQDPTKVKEGVASLVSKKLNIAKEELEKYPEKLLTDMNFLQETLKETLVMIGAEKFEALLRSIGYEEQEKTTEL